MSDAFHFMSFHFMSFHFIISPRASVSRHARGADARAANDSRAPRARSRVASRSPFANRSRSRVDGGW